MLKDLSEFRETKAVELGRQSEMLMSTQTHMCNIGIKVGLLQPEKGLKLKDVKTGMVHICKTAEDVIKFNQASMTTLEQQNKINPETKEQRAVREKHNEKVVKRCKEIVDRRNYQKLTENIAGFSNAGDLQKRHDKQDMQFTITFGFGFITLMFLGFLSGYMFGRKILEYEPLESMFVSIFVGIVTLLVEMMLMIFRLDKYDKMQDIERKRINKID